MYCGMARSIAERRRDPVTGRCFRCGRFVPNEGLGTVVYDGWTGGYEYVEGECPPGYGCAIVEKHPSDTGEVEIGVDNGKRS